MISRVQILAVVRGAIVQWTGRSYKLATDSLELAPIWRPRAAAAPPPVPPPFSPLSQFLQITVRMLRVTHEFPAPIHFVFPRVVGQEILEGERGGRKEEGWGGAVSGAVTRDKAFSFMFSLHLINSYIYMTA
jgi:hypothetical protein